ncbi:hypothetical protein SAMN02800692_1541 [Luteibacter sp. UNC138MFCol5.1]|uniref:hypothetical protein n=1 Tax=Luteibacter sp. UNC138MFCol5.1 TaxID=1502774 RepID=UPI0008CBE717|nr:hypothetical protein [Luteibacter sp. UNC138MFCol5.1]SEO63874.1 hypothetical protein SAMN02800692_1541 [Luteibacter sp. UNC138MFCol5.1]
MHDNDLDDLATIAAMTVRLAARASAAGNSDAAASVNDIASSCMAWLCLTLDVNGDEVRSRAAQRLADERAMRAAAVH